MLYMSITRTGTKAHVRHRQKKNLRLCGIFFFLEKLLLHLKIPIKNSNL